MARKIVDFPTDSKTKKETETTGTDLVAFKNEKAELIKGISDLEIQVKKLQEKEKELKESMLAAMEEYGIKSFSIEDGDSKVTFTYVAETTQKKLDTTSLKKDHPDICEQYMKESSRSAYIMAKVG